MIEVDKQLKSKGLKAKMIMQVHDELVFNIKPDELDTMQELIKRNMENAYKGRVPLIVSAGIGNNWLEAH